MRFHFESEWAKMERLKQWHEWFAWRPVRIGEQIVWLEYIQRRGFFPCGVISNRRWFYKLKP